MDLEHAISLFGRPVCTIGPRVHLRYPDESDRDEFVALRQQSRDHLERWEPLASHNDDWYAPSAFDRELDNANTPTEQRWIIGRNADNMILGRIALGNIERGPFQNGRFGYWIGQPFANQGYMSEAITIAVRHALLPTDRGGLGLHRLCANIMPSNIASRRVLEKSGFTQEGFSQNYLQIQGAWEDHERWAITSESLG